MTFLILLGYAVASYIFKDAITDDTFVLFTGMAMMSLAIINRRKDV